MERIAISTAFDENTVRAIARGAHERGALTKRVIRDQTHLFGVAQAAMKAQPWNENIKLFSTLQPKRADSGALPEDVKIAPVSELVRVAAGRRRSRLTHSLGNARWKTYFDRVAARIDFGEAQVLLSMPGSSLRTFTANRDRRLVFHEIDAHPRVRNELLEEHFGRQRARAEMFPSWFVERIEQEIMLADHVLVPSALVAEQMRDNNVADEKLVMVPYGVDPSVFRPHESIGPREPGPVRIVCTAQISLRKGIPHLIEAVRGQSVELTLVGSVFDARILSDLPSNVTVAGVLTAEQLVRLYARSDLFVLPSIEDNFALVVTEAAGAGLPVVTTRQVGSHDLLSARHTVIEAGDVAALRETIAHAGPLSFHDRLEISAEAIGQGWRSWDEYAEGVLKGIGVLA